MSMIPDFNHTVGRMLSGSFRFSFDNGVTLFLYDDGRLFIQPKNHWMQRHFIGRHGADAIADIMHMLSNADDFQTALDKCDNGVKV